MGKLWAITAREYIERVTNKWFIITTVFGPMLFGALIYLPAWISSRSRASQDIARITIIDATGAELGKRVAVSLNGGLMGDTSRTRIVTTDSAGLAEAERAATLEIVSGSTKGYLALDPRLLSGGQLRYSGTNASAAADMLLIRRAVNEQVLRLRLEREGVSPATAAQLARLNVSIESERVTRRGRVGSGRVSIIFALGVALLLYTSIFIYGQNVLRGVIEEKQTRVAEVVLSSVSAAKLLAGKVLGVGAVGITQMILWGLTSVLLFKLRGPVLTRLGASPTPLNLPEITAEMAALLVTFFVLGYTLYAALFAAIGAMVSTEQEAQQAQIPVVMLLAASVIFFQPILLEPDGGIAKAMSWIPFSAPIIMPLRLSVVPVSTTDVAISIVIVAASCYIAVWTAARIYRVGLLMYGKRPGIREMAKWMRFAS